MGAQSGQAPVIAQDQSAGGSDSQISGKSQGKNQQKKRYTTRENPSSSAGFVLTSSAGRRATNKALQLLLSSNACHTRYC